jgi:hypothetical protein
MHCRYGFIVGTGRCGTTILAKMLNVHSEICVPHELQILLEHNQNGERLYEIFSKGANQYFQCSDYINLIEQSCPYDWKKTFDYPAFFKTLTYPLQGYNSLMTNLYAAVAVSQGKSLFLEQTPWYGQRIDVIHRVFPDARYIHIVRDGRDVALSFLRTKWWHDSFDRNLRRWVREIVNINHLGQSFAGSDRFLLVKYEDLVLDPRSVLESICLFLELNFEAAMLDPRKFAPYERYFKGQVTSYQSRAEQAWQNNSAAATFADRLYAWKKDASVAHRHLPDEASQLLTELGYSLDP